MSAHDLYTRALAELRRYDAAQFGGKSANLGELLSVGISVPSGFALGASAFQAFTRTTGLDRAIADAMSRVSPNDVGTITAAAQTIDEAIRSASLPPAIHDELARRYDEVVNAVGVPEAPVAVRSSALGEDSEDATYAGQQETFLWRHGIEEMCEAVRACWASLYSDRAISYRAARAPTEAEPAMGVTVQLMVDAEISGVMFTCNPVSGDPSMVAVNASWGLGLAVVGGEVTPDDYLVSKVTGEVVRTKISAKEIEYVPDRSGRGAVRVDVPAERSDRSCLSEEHLAALVKVGKRIERHFGSHQDVEWAVRRGEALPEGLVALQTRPVTGLPERARKPTASALSLVMDTFGAASHRP